MKAEVRKLEPGIMLCVLLDLMGMISYSLPGLGEFSDIIWAPFSAYMFYKIFGGSIGRIGAALNFVEEILPFTDFVPSFTIAWIIRRVMDK